MQPTTLRGIFPERKVAPRKNFIKENVRRLRQMQIEVSRQGSSETRVGMASKCALGLSKTNTLSRQKVNEQEPVPRARQSPTRRPGIQKLEIKPISKPEVKFTPKIEKEEKVIHRGVQTEQNDNVDSIYSTGTIRFPSPSIVSTINKTKKQRRQERDHGHGDSLQNSDMVRANKIDYIKRNMLVKAKSPEKDPRNREQGPPSNYKRGTVPKYIRQKKDEMTEEAGDVECPPGHVLLPDDERKETLKVLRESYAEKIQELNSMPVRSDTLRMQKRKLELEEELKKIDEGIKVFQRPKVFVKINV